MESQCAEDYFYSSRDPQGTERAFQEMEGAYGGITQKIWSGKDSTEGDFFSLVWMMFDLHCRNVCYANQTQGENVHAYNVRIHCLRTQILMGDSCGAVSDQELLAHLHAVWRVRLLETTKGNELATCDNPAHWFTFDETHKLHFVVMPVTPFYYAVAFDKRFGLAIGSGLSATDEACLNRLQAMNCWECLFTSSELSADQQRFVREKWKEREKPFGYVDAREWSVNLIRADRDCFSFLTKV